MNLKAIPTQTGSTKERIEEICHKVFINNSYYSENEKEFLMTYQNLFKLMKDCGIISKSGLSPTEFEIIVRNAAKIKFKFTFQSFLDILVLITKKLLSLDFTENPQQSLLKLTNQYFAVLINNNKDDQVGIVTSGEASSNNRLVQIKTQQTSADQNVNLHDVNSYNIEAFEGFFEQFELDRYSQKVISSVYNCILEIYSFYFYFELRKSSDMHKTKDEGLKSLIKFAKEFEVMPYYIGLTALNKYWHVFGNYNHLLVIDEDKNVGSLYKISDFALTIIHLSQFYYMKQYNHHVTQQNNSLNLSSGSHNSFQNDVQSHSEVDKLLLFLQYLSNSKGLDNVKQLKTNSKDFNLIPSIEILKSVESKAMYPKFSLIKNLSSFDFNSGRYLNLLKNEKLQTDLKGSRSMGDIKKNNSDLNRNNILVKFNEEPDTFKLKNLLELSPKTISIVESQYIKGLKRIFTYYSRIGDKLNFDFLSITSWSKIFQDVGIISKKNPTGVYINKNLIFKKGLVEYHNKVNKDYLIKEEVIKDGWGQMKETDLKLIYTALTGKKNFRNINSSKQEKVDNSTTSFNTKFILKTDRKSIQNKMNFKLFVKSLELISEKLFEGLDPDTSFLKFLNEVSF